jgi:hypothetical protein
MLVLATCGVAGVCSDMHGEGVAACGWLYSAPPARAVCGGTRRGAAGSVHRLCRCVHGAPRHGLRASTVSNRQPRGSRFPGHAPAAEWAPGARDPIAVAAAASRSGASERARAATWKMLESPSRTVGSGNEAGPQPFATLMQQQSGGGGGGPEAEGRSLSGGI